MQPKQQVGMMRSLSQLWKASPLMPHFFDDLSVFIPFKLPCREGCFFPCVFQQFLGAAPNSSSPPPRRDLGISLGISDRMVGFGSFFVGFCSRFSAQIWPG